MAAFVMNSSGETVLKVVGFHPNSGVRRITGCETVFFLLEELLDAEERWILTFNFPSCAVGCVPSRFH